MSVNKTILIGNLGADPELKYTTSGTAVANFSIATSESWIKDGERQEKTEWHRIVAWNKTAELCGQYLSKGRQVYIEGKLQTRQWEDRDGNKRYTTEVVAQQVTFLGGGNGERPPRQQQRQEQRQPAATGSDFGPPPYSDDDVPF